MCLGRCSALLCVTRHNRDVCRLCFVCGDLKSSLLSDSGDVLKIFSSDLVHYDDDFDDCAFD